MGEVDRNVSGPRAASGLLVVLALVGCSAEPHATSEEAPIKRVTAEDGSFELSVPEDWETIRRSLAGDVVVAERDPGGGARVLASHQRSEVGAEQRAITAAGRLTADGIFCERLDDSEVFGGPHLVFDCPYADGTRQLLFPVAGEGESALVAIRVRGATLAATDDVVSPIIGSFAWTEPTS